MDDESVEVDKSSRGVAGLPAQNTNCTQVPAICQAADRDATLPLNPRRVKIDNIFLHAVYSQLGQSPIEGLGKDVGERGALESE